ncbi:hypothetical protein OUZ56_022532 [Daphnia magna]|uniref:Uncharacterized protein n=1 Tax=Daphnia magna TaxID=35525 RepID=A0ABR0AWP0_9CRUS|nr:hypothetical protein OUZ56_022532 [Daphnia magna]
MPEFSSKQVSGWGGVLMNSERRSDVESFGSSGHRVLRYLCGNLPKKLAFMNFTVLKFWFHERYSISRSSRRPYMQGHFD